MAIFGYNIRDTYLIARIFGIGHNWLGQKYTVITKETLKFWVFVTTKIDHTNQTKRAQKLTTQIQ